jgi:AcrR family transcriptional regulator
VWYQSKGSDVKHSRDIDGDGEAQSTRKRILSAAFNAFMERGYAAASTLDIATRAKVSKRELYSHFKNKEALFAAGIAERTAGMQIPIALPEVADLDGLAKTLVAAGVAVMKGVTDDHVLAVHRLAIAESARSPDVAQTLDRFGRRQVRQAVVTLFEKARERGLVEGDADEMADAFCSVLLSDVILRLLLGVARKPSAKEMAQRAQVATELSLHVYAAGAASRSARQKSRTR